MGFQFRKLIWLQRKIQRNFIQVQNYPALSGRNLISTCNRRVKYVPAGRGEISSPEPGSCNYHVM